LAFRAVEQFANLLNIRRVLRCMVGPHRLAHLAGNDEAYSTTRRTHLARDVGLSTRLQPRAANAASEPGTGRGLRMTNTKERQQKMVYRNAREETSSWTNYLSDLT